MSLQSMGRISGQILAVVAGIGLIALGLFANVPVSYAVLRRLGDITGGLFFIYCGLMYYLPKNRRRRRELDELIAELEREPDSK